MHEPPRPTHHHARAASPRPRETARQYAALLGASAWLMLWASAAFGEVEIPLDTGSAFEGRLAPDQRALFRLAADDRPRLVTVVSLGIDLVLEVRGPAGFEATVDGPGGNRGRDSMLVPPSSAEPFSISLTVASLGEAPAGYRLTVEDLDPDDPLRLAAETAITAAGRAHAMGEAERAVAHLAEATALLAEDGTSPARLAEVTTALAAGLDAAGQTAQAVAAWQQALARWKGLGERTDEAQARFGLANAHLRRSELDHAAASLERAATLWRGLGDALGAVHTRAAQCLIDHRRGSFSSAGTCYEEVAAQAAELGARGLEALVTSSLGGVLQALGEPRRAFESHRCAVLLRQATDDPRGEAQARNNLGALFRSLGEGAKAAGEYRAALAIFEAEGDRLWQARTLNNLAYADLVGGDTGRAHRLFEASLVLRRQVGDRNGEAVTLSNLGRAHLLGGNTEAALDAFRASFEIRQALGHRRGDAAALQMIGTALVLRGEHAAALEVLTRALEAQRTLGDRPRQAAVLLRRGQALLGLGQGEAAQEALTETLERFVALDDPAGQLDSLKSLAEAASSRGAAGEAVGLVRTARALIERQRLRYGDPLRRATYLAAQARIFELEIRQLMSRHAMEPHAGHDREAFATAEAARARSLLDRLAAGTVEQGLDRPLRVRLADARHRLDAKAALAERLRARGTGTDSLVTADADVQRALADIESLWAEIHDRAPRFTALARPASLDTEAVMRALAEDTLLLAYSLGSESSYLWALGNGRMTAHELPARPAIESLARTVHRDLASVDLRTRASDPEARERLAQIVLAPVAARLSGRRLMIIADGALHYVPFAALPHPSRAAMPLAAQHQVLMLPAASLLLAAPPPPRTVGAGRIAIVADPVFRANDRRIVQGANRDSEAVFGSGADLALPAAIDRLPHLTHAHREVTAIADLARDRADRFTGFAATPLLVTGGTLDRHRVLHFATHGWLDPAHPELSAIVLSRFDEQGHQQPGMLRLHDLFGLDLDAQLVVLSGCRTALGREVRGEGLLGLARGFLYAGAGSVVASLWPVDDEAAALFMEALYRGLLVEGQSPVSALGAAQLAVRAERRFRDPAYWAPFVLLGGTGSMNRSGTSALIPTPIDRNAPEIEP